MKIKSFKSSVTTGFILLMMLMISSCECVPKPPTNKVIPPVLVPTVEESRILRERVPGFYVRFAVQQKQISEVK